MDATNKTQQQTVPLETPVADDLAELTLCEATVVRGGSLAVKTGVRAGRDASGKEMAVMGAGM